MKSRDFEILENYLNIAKDALMEDYSNRTNKKEELIKKLLLIDIAIDDITSSAITNNFNFLNFLHAGLEYNFVETLRIEASKKGEENGQE